VLLACLIGAVAAVISFRPRESPAAPNPGPLPEYVKKLETITVKLPGGVPLEMVRIPAGSFEMGADHIQYDWLAPVHTVNIKQDFYIGRYEVTQAQWLAVMGGWPAKVSPWRRMVAWFKKQPILSEPNPRDGKGPNYPAYFISWHDCKEFIKVLNEHIRKTGQGPVSFRLPSEAEWEYACRAGTQTRFFFGDSLGHDYGNHIFADGPAGVLPGNRSDYMRFGASDYPPSVAVPGRTTIEQTG
jgi:formylglycine-generating enzyme required for sulfatase activity